MNTLQTRLVLGQSPVNYDTLVFGTIEGGLRRPPNLSKSWSRLTATKGLPKVTFHDLRHTHVSMLLRAGVDVLTVSRRIKHSNASITLDVYGHLMKGTDAAAANAIEGLLR